MPLSCLTWMFKSSSGKLITKITIPIVKSTSPGLSDTTFFARLVLSFAPYLYIKFADWHELGRKESLDESLHATEGFGFGRAELHVKV